ncbi:hypothetical protein [Nocardioides astragali]|uniref:Uncharacterized protein n=1 Tax=Nocardioides astragali TaxID=1776736 RepID=A0ABW2N1W6_9ACTN|nr:hypothetical protein [Nocardioides astragali]
MSQESDRRQARGAVAGYHGARLAELVAPVADAIDRFRGGELDAFDVDEVLFQYSRAAKELWKFCNIGDIELTAGQLHDGAPIDWWERGASTRARHPPVNEVPTSEPS